MYKFPTRFNAQYMFRSIIADPIAIFITVNLSYSMYHVRRNRIWKFQIGKHDV